MTVKFTLSWATVPHIISILSEFWSMSVCIMERIGTVLWTITLKDYRSYSMVVRYSSSNSISSKVEGVSAKGAIFRRFWVNWIAVDGWHMKINDLLFPRCVRDTIKVMSFIMVARILTSTRTGCSQRGMPSVRSNWKKICGSCFYRSIH